MSAILVELFGRLSSCFVDPMCGFLVRHAGYVHKLKGNLADMKTAIEDLTASKKQVVRRVLSEEKQQKIRLEEVALWFERVDKALAEGGELIQSGDQELGRLCFGGYCSKSCWSTSIFGKQVEKSLLHLHTLKAKEFAEVAAPAELVAKLPHEPTVGLKAKLNEVWSCIENKDVVGLYGIGGVGKTTLLIEIHNKFVDTCDNINLIWVVVGKDARPEKIQEGIVKKMRFSNDGSGNIREEIYNSLLRNKFILFLYDIWKRIDLVEMIGVPSPEELKLNGSKIIFSTRSQKLCYDMRAQERIRVEILEPEDAWELFRTYVGEDTINIDREIPQLAQSMATKCGGLPIALKTIGRAMSGKLDPREWQHSIDILKKPSRDLQGLESDELLKVMEDEVFSLLRYSYDSLPNDKLKSCFLYCALYPDDELITKVDLLFQWICEDFWDGDFTREAYNEVYSIIGILVRSCLLEDLVLYVKMHDVIRDMALRIEKENVLVMAGMQLKEAPRVEKWEGVRRLSLMKNDIKKLTQVPPCQKLVTLFLSKNPGLYELDEDFFHFMSAVTVLDLSDTSLRSLPKSVEKLVSLQYLSIRSAHIRRLPVELAKLSKLKYLDLSSLRLKARVSERVISSLSCLQVLEMENCSYEYEEVMEELGKKDDWEEYVPPGFANEMQLFQELELLEYLEELHLTISSVWMLERLKTKSQNLVTAIKGVWLKDFEETESLDICLLPNMESLSYLEFAGCKFKEIGIAVQDSATAKTSQSAVVRSSSGNFSCLCLVSLESCHYLNDLTMMLVLLPNLATLGVSMCGGMEEIISDVKLSEVVIDTIGQGNPKPFSKLSTLLLVDLPELRSIYQNALPFPLLSNFYVQKCPVLKKLPFDSNSRHGPRIDLRVERDWWEAIEWEDDATKAALLPRFKCTLHSIEFNPKVVIWN